MPRPRYSLLAFLGFLLVFPFFLRRRPRVERRVTILMSPEEIFPLVNDLRNWPQWTVWGNNAESEHSFGELAVGVGAEQHWRNPNMEGTLRIIRSDPNARIDYEFDLANGKYFIRGRLDFAKDGACTRVSWRCVWELAANPYMRYADLFFQWMIGRDFAEGLSNLKAVAEGLHLENPDAK